MSLVYQVLIGIIERKVTPGPIWCFLGCQLGAQPGIYVSVLYADVGADVSAIPACL